MPVSGCVLNVYVKLADAHGPYVCGVSVGIYGDGDMTRMEILSFT